MKKYQLLILILLNLYFTKCDKFGQDQLADETPTNEVVLEQINIAEERAILYSYLNGLSEIQSKLEGITKKHEILISPDFSRETRKDRGREALKQIDAIDDYIAELESKIKKKGSSSLFQRKQIKTLNKIIKSQKKQVYNLKLEIENLEDKNYDLILLVKGLNDTIVKKDLIITQSNEQIKELYSELSEKYCMLVLKDDYKKKRITGNRIQFEKTIRKKNIISDHPSRSYSILDNHTIKINSKSFWLNTNYLIVRINKNKCNFSVD